MSKGKSLKKQWQDIMTETAKALTQFYTNNGSKGGSEVATEAMALVVERWKNAMKSLNPSVALVQYDGNKSFDELETDSLVKLEFVEPHPSFLQFAMVVRQVAAVGQKVS